MSKRITLLTAVIMAAVCYVAAQDVAVAVATDTAASAAVLTITTDPVEAAVSVDGRDYGASPVEVTGLAPGSHTIEISKPGYFRRRAVVQLDSSGAELHFELSRPATLTITSDPDGARVSYSINEKGTAPGQPEEPGETPRILERLRPGVYTVSAATEGYAALDTTVTVESGANDTLHIKLKPLPPPEPEPVKELAATQDASHDRADKPKKKKGDQPSGKKSWKAETVLVAFFVFIAVMIGVEAASY